MTEGLFKQILTVLKIIKAAIYIRVSTEEQKKKGYSLQDQIDACKRKAQELGATEIEVFSDEGESGKFVDRPGMNRLLAAVRSGDVQLVIVLDLDRLARDLATQLYLTDEIEKHCLLEFVNHTRGNPNNPEDTMFFQLKGVFSQYECSKIRERTAAGRREKALEGKIVNPGGWAGHPGVFGYIFINEKKESRFEIIEAEADIVKYIYKLALVDELSIGQITDRLNREKIPAPKGGVWHPNSVKRLLTNEVYAGTFHNFKYESIMTDDRTDSGKRQHLHRERPKEDHILAEVPSIIDRETWEAVQKKYNICIKQSIVNHQALLKGRIKCSSCGSLYSPQLVGKNLYYRCRGRKNKCKMPMISVNILDNIVWEEIIRLLSNPALIREYIGNPDTTAIKEGENNMQKLQAKIKSIAKHKDELFSLRLDGLLSVEELKKRLIQAESKKNGLSAELVSIQERLVNLKKPLDFNVDDFCDYFLHRIAQATFQEKVEVIRDLDLMLVHHPEKVIEINWPFGNTTMRLEPKWQDNMGFSMTPEMKTALGLGAINYHNASELIREAILQAPIDAEYKKAPRGNRVYSNVLLTEDTFNKVKQLQGTYQESAMRIIEWALEWHLKQLGYL